MTQIKKLLIKLEVRKNISSTFVKRHNYLSDVA